MGHQSEGKHLALFRMVVRNGFRQRGHNLVWPAWKFNPFITKEIALTDTALFNRFIKAQFYERMAYTKHRVVAWDVVNEPMHEKEFFAYLPKTSWWSGINWRNDLTLKRNCSSMITLC